MYYLYSFRSRNQSMKFFEALKRSNIYSRVVATPRSISVGCGLSVNVSANLVDIADKVFNSDSYDTFIGLFYMYNNEVRKVR